MTDEKRKNLIIAGRQLGKTNFTTETIKKYYEKNMNDREKTEKFTEEFHTQKFSAPKFSYEFNCKSCGEPCVSESETTDIPKNERNFCYECLKNAKSENKVSPSEIRKFDSGAIRDSENGKEDFIETISWIALRRYADFMTKCKSRYGSGNFKKGIPIESYERSLVRHLQKYLANKYENQDIESDSCHLCAMLFNIFGILHEEESKKIKKSNEKTT